MWKRTAAAALLVVLGASGVPAELFPTRQITLVVPYAAGGNVDVTTRIIQAEVGMKLGQPIVVENRAGAGGMIAGDFVARSVPDGHTLMIASNGPIVFAPMAMPKPMYQWQDAFEPVTMFSTGTNVIVARAGLPVRDMGEMIAFAKATPEKLTVGVDSGVSINHFLSELTKLSAKVQWSEVRYRGNAPAITDLVAGHIDASFMQLLDAVEHLKTGKLKALAVLGKARSPSLPDVPTAAEQGFPQVEGVVFNGLLAPKGTPREAIDKLNAAFRGALASPGVIERLKGLGAETRGTSPEEFAAFLRAETTKWTAVLKEANIKFSE